MGAFKLGEVVRVQVFHVITTGTIQAITTKEFLGKRETVVTYDVCFNAGKLHDYVTPDEASLIYVQTLPLGKMERP